MNKSKFTPLSFRAINEKEKYLPGLDPGFPMPNEILEFMACLSSTSYKENVKNGKVNHNESEIGFKILLTLLPFRNVFAGAYASLENIQTYCTGYSLKSIRKGADWLVSKGLFLTKKGKCNRNEYSVNYTGASYEEIVSDITRQLENDISKEKVVFKGIRKLTTTENKKENDGKAIGNFTYIPFFLPEAKRIEIEGMEEWVYLRNTFFDSLDGNTLKVILQLAYKQHFNTGMKKDPTTRIKIETLQKLCSVSRNKILKALDYLITGGFLRAYKVGRNSRAYIFNFRSYRLAKVTKNLEKRRKIRTKRPIVIVSSFPVSGLSKETSFPVSEKKNEEVFPSQDCYNKNLNLNKIKDSYDKDESNFFFSKSFETEEGKEKKFNAVLHDLDLDKEKGLIPYLEWLAIRTYFVKRKPIEELYSKDELLKSYYESKSFEKRKEEEKDLVMA